MDETQYKQGQQLKLKIKDLASGGDGVAKAPDGRVVMVRGALPGEKVLARLTKVKRDFMQAVAESVQQASPKRVRPRCPLYERCGGCDLMHLDYDAQVSAKAQWVQSMLRKLDDLPRIKAVASPRAWHYRNRVRLQVQGRAAGFYQKNSHSLAPVNQCLIAHKSMGAILAGINDILGRDGAAGVQWVELLGAESGGPFVTLGLSPKARLGLDRRKRIFKDLAELGCLEMRVSRGGVLEDYKLEDEAGVVQLATADYRVMAFPGLFCQNNFTLNKTLVAAVVEAASQGPDGPLLDLYAGSGNFSIPLAAAGREVLAVEGDERASAACSWLARQAGLLGELQIRSTDAAAMTEELAVTGQRFAQVVLDPPRGGAKGLMGHVAQLRPGRVIYVSCHPAALARDAVELAKLGYRAAQLHCLDMFPQTSHVEAVLVMDRA